MCFTVHHTPCPPTPTADLVCVSPGASWVTDVCYPTPSELAQCGSQCQRGASYRPACLCEPQGAGARQRRACAGIEKPYLAFLSRGADSTKAWSMKGDKRCLWSSGIDMLPGLTHSKGRDEWMCQTEPRCQHAYLSVCVGCLSAQLCVDGAACDEWGNVQSGGCHMSQREPCLRILRKN